MELLCIILDGMTRKVFDYLKSIKNSALGEILRSATGVEIVSTFPSETAAANATLLTGKAPSEHGLVGNEFFINSKFLRISFDIRTDAPSLLHFVNYSCLDINTPTIFEIMEEKGLKTAVIHAIYRGASVAAPDFFVDKEKKWEYRRIFATFLMRYLVLGARGINKMNKFVVELATKIIITEDPDFLVLWIPFMDKIAHDYDFDTSLQTLTDLDKSFKKLLEFVRNCKVVIMSDHGHSHTPKKVDLAKELLKEGIKARYISGRGILQLPTADVLISQNGRAVFMKCNDESIAERVISILRRIPDVDQVIYRGELRKGYFDDQYPLATERLEDLTAGKYSSRVGDIIVTFKPGSTIKGRGKSINQHSSMHVADSLAPFYVLGADNVKVRTMKDAFYYLLKLVEV
jgi:hypothetical protein